MELYINPEQVNDVPDTVVRLSSLAEKARSAIISVHDVIEKPPICFEILSGDISSEIGTLGNISLWQGKAKQGKTFAISLALAAAEIGETLMDKMKISLPPDQKVILNFDTEQGRYHVQRVIKRICRIAGRDEPLNLVTYGLRKYAAAERLEIIEHELYNTENLGFVIIDGIRDLVTSINDEEQASMMASKLLKWSEELNIHIAVVLHTNKNDDNARGHLGTELTNKAETVVSIGKNADNKEEMRVKPVFCRARDFEEFGFMIDDYGIPYIIEVEQDIKPGRKTLTPIEIDKKTHAEVLTSVFKISGDLKYGDLVDQVKDFFMRYGIKFGLNKSKEFITYYINEGMILKDESAGKYPIYKSGLN